MVDQVVRCWHEILMMRMKEMRHDYFGQGFAN